VAGTLGESRASLCEKNHGSAGAAFAAERLAEPKQTQPAKAGAQEGIALCSQQADIVRYFLRDF